MRRKILMGVLALALPIGSVVGLSTAASAKSSVPPDPARNCTVSGTVVFQAPGLSKNGDISATQKTSTTTATSSFAGGCTGSTGTLNITSKNTKCKGPNNPSGTGCEAKHTYSYDTESSFASTGTSSILKSLKKLNFTLDGVAYQTKSSASASVVCSNTSSPPGGVSTEVGFKISGSVKGPKQDKGAATTLTACLGTDTGPGTSGSFFEDLGSGIGTIQTASIDVVTSTATIAS